MIKKIHKKWNKMTVMKFKKWIKRMKFESK